MEHTVRIYIYIHWPESPFKIFSRLCQPYAWFYFFFRFYFIFISSNFTPCQQQFIKITVFQHILLIKTPILGFFSEERVALMMKVTDFIHLPCSSSRQTEQPINNINTWVTTTTCYYSHQHLCYQQQIRFIYCNNNLVHRKRQFNGGWGFITAEEIFLNFFLCVN